MTTPVTAGGYDYQFVNKPLDMFLCKICHLPSRNPHLSLCCGHIFCKSCLDNAKDAIASFPYHYNVRNAQYVCPMCRSIEFTTVPNKQICREVRSLQIFCTNKEKGCTWQGEVNSICNHLLSEHNDGCQFETVKCFNACGIKLQRQHLTSHVETKCPYQIIECQYCELRRQRRFIIGKHIEECPRFPLPCPNGCGINNIPRKDTDKHRAVCLHEIVQCRNFCRKKMQRQYLTNHLENECPRRKVTCQHCCSLIEYQYIESPHKEQCHKFPLPCPNDCGILEIPREDVSQHREICPLEIIQCTNKCGNEIQRQRLDSHLEGHCPRRKICCQYCNIEGEHQFISGDHMIVCDKFPLICPNECNIGTVCRGDLDEHREVCPLETIDCEYCKVGCKAKMLRKDLEKHCDESMKKHLLLTTKKLTSTEDELDRFRERVHTLETAMQQIINGKSMSQHDRLALWPCHLQLANSIIANTPGEHVTPVIMKVSNFTGLKLQKKKWFSPPFYTHEKGYKMCVSVYPNGLAKGEGTHLSVFLHIMKGPYDNYLPWPLIAIFDLILLNQIDDTEHHVYKVQLDHDKNGDRVINGERGKGRGNQGFISNENLDKKTFTRRFLCNDTVFIKVCLCGDIYDDYDL